MTLLRLQMIRELELQRMRESTIKAYVWGVSQLAAYYGRSPDKITIDEIRNYIHYLVTERKLSFSSCNQRLAAIRFFYLHVLGKDNFNLRVPAKRSGRLPEPLSREEVARLLTAAQYNQKHRALLMTAYGTGLRVSELVHLRLVDIHSERMLIRVNQGKGRKDRYTLLSPGLLRELREYWKQYRPEKWLFAGKVPTNPLSRSSAGKIFHKAKRLAKVTHGQGIHTLRHSFASHLLCHGRFEMSSSDRSHARAERGRSRRFPRSARAWLPDIANRRRYSIVRNP